jgi:hypothetical protein
MLHRKSEFLNGTNDVCRIFGLGMSTGPLSENTEQQSEQHEIIKDKVRKVAMCGDQNRIQNSNLLDKMATIAGQIAVVARMGDDATSDTDDIDDRYE